MGISTTPTKIANMVRVTYEHFMAAQEAVKVLNWTTYGREMQATQLALEKLVEATESWVGLLRPLIPSVKR